MQGREANTAIPGACLVVFFPTEFAVCKLSRTCLSMLWSLITHVFHVDNNFRQSLVVKKPLEEEDAATTRLICTAQIFNAGVSFFASIYTSSRPSRADCVVHMRHTNVHV